MSKSGDGAADVAKRLAMLRSYIDGDTPLVKVAVAAGISLRTARRWIVRMPVIGGLMPV